MNFKMKSIYVLALLLFVASCKKEDPQPNGQAEEKGLLVLNEGLFQLNNSSLTWINEEKGTVDLEFFEHKTGRQLGDTGNDILRYGGKIYIIVNVSSTIEVLDAKTFEPIQQISITEGGNSVEPRFMTAINGEIFFSTFAGKVWSMDTTNFDISSKIQVGANPDHITNDGQYIYVSNSGGLDPSIYDSTISVINPLTKTEVKRIKVSKNPGRIIVGGDHNIYAITRGNYTTLLPQIHRINPTTLEKDTTFAIQATHLVDFSSAQMVVGIQINGGQIKLAKFDFASSQVKDLDFINTSDINTLNNIQYSKESQLFYLMDANNYTNTGTIRVYQKNGAFKKTYIVGLNPTKLLEFK